MVVDDELEPVCVLCGADASLGGAIEQEDIGISKRVVWLGLYQPLRLDGCVAQADSGQD